MLEKKNLTIGELKEEHDQGRIYLFKGHVKQMNIMLVEEKDRATLAEDEQRCPSSYRGVIRRTIRREGCTLEELAKRDFNEDVKLEIQKMIFEQKQNVKQERKMISASIKPLVIACRLTDRITHLVDVGLNVHKEPLSLSNRALCGKIITRENILKFDNEATCEVCRREWIKRNKLE